MKKFLLLVCIFVCATRVCCAATDDKYGWLTRLGMYLRKSHRRIAKELQGQGLYKHLLLQKNNDEGRLKPGENCYDVKFLKDSNVYIAGRRMLVDDLRVIVVTYDPSLYCKSGEPEVSCGDVIDSILLKHPKKFISFLRKVFAKDLVSAQQQFDEPERIDYYNACFAKSDSKVPQCGGEVNTILRNNSKEVNSIIDKELSRATQCGVAAMVGVAAAGAGLYFLRNEIATGVKNGTQSLVAAVASGLGK